MANRLLDAVEFNPNNPAPRCAFVLLVDTSSSMAGEKIAKLNQGLETLHTDLCDHAEARNSVELCVVKFDSSVEIVVPFVSPEQYQPPTLVANGATAFVEAIHFGLDLLEARRREYQEHGISYYAPWLWALTDAVPTDSQGHALSRDNVALNDAAKRLREAAVDPVKKKTRIDAFMVGVGTASGHNVDFDILRKFSPQREPLLLHHGTQAFLDMFQWIRQSLIRVSASRPGDVVTHEKPGWGTTG